MNYLGIIGKKLPVIKKLIEYSGKNSEYKIVHIDSNIYSLFKIENIKHVDTFIVSNLDKLIMLEGIVLILSMFPDSKIILLINKPDSDFIMRSIKLGADGLIDVHSELNHLIDSIWHCSKGAAVISPSINRTLFNNIYNKKPFVPDGITVRETEVLNCLVEGLSNKLIAVRLSIGIETVRTHIKNLCGKFNVNSRIEVICRLFRENTNLHIPLSGGDF